MRQLRLLLPPLLLILVLAATTKADMPDGTMIVDVENAIVIQTNDFRKENGLPLVAVNKELTASASKFAKFMADSGKYGHHADGRSPAERANASGYEYCVIRENIAYRMNTGEVTAESLIEVFVQGWIDSPPHRENMLADYATETGVAVASSDGVTYYAVQLFGRPKSAAIELKVTNVSVATRTLVVRANDSEDEVELPPGTVLTMKQCFPATLSLLDSNSDIKLTESTEVTITNEGLN